MPSISAVIITYNEEKNIGRCIKSLQKISDEILIVDSFSTDKTKQICLEYGARFMEREFKCYYDQKNFALTKAKHEHILSLDADEYLSEELIASILEIKESWPCEAYKISRISSYGGRWIKHGCWYPDNQIRLWNKNFGNWQEKSPHEKVIMQNGAKVKLLQGKLFHESYENCTVTLNKIQLFSDVFSSESKIKKNISVFGILLHTSFSFFKSYILKRGFIDGFEGLMVAAAVANHTFYKYAKLFEKNRLALKKLKK